MALLKEGDFSKNWLSVYLDLMDNVIIFLGLYLGDVMK